jgi:di/tricarboxylate transporter
MKATIATALVLMLLVFGISQVQDHSPTAAKCGAVIAGLLSVSIVWRLHRIGWGEIEDGRPPQERSFARATLLLLIVLGVAGGFMGIATAYQRTLGS